MTKKTKTAALAIKPFTVDDPVPVYAAAWPLPKEQWEHFVNTPQIITFTAKVPLHELMTRSAFGLAILMEDAFNKEAALERPSFLVVGHEQGGEGAMEGYCGCVELQVIAKLYANE